VNAVCLADHSCCAHHENASEEASEEASKETI